jgi:hypothetical protein
MTNCMWQFYEIRNASSTSHFTTRTTVSNILCKQQQQREKPKSSSEFKAAAGTSHLNGDPIVQLLLLQARFGDSL